MVPEAKIQLKHPIIMKKVLLVLSFAVMAVFSASAQSTVDYGPNADECKKYISFYSDYYKQKNYESALPNWRKAYNLCPVTSRYSILTHGTTLMKYLINKNKLNPAYKEQLVDSLMTIYKQRIEYWPKYRTASLNNYALDLYNFYQDNPKALYAGLNEAVNQLGAQTELKTFPIYMKVACDLYNDGGIEIDEVMSVYENSMAYLGQINTEGNEIKFKTVEKTKGEVDAIFGASGVANCDNLVAIYGPKVAADPTNVELAKSVASKLSKVEGGLDTDLFINTMKVWYDNEPSAQSAYMLYKLNSSRGDNESAQMYLENAINSGELDFDTMAEYCFELAVFASKNGNNAKAIEAANKAIEVADVMDGKAYLLMGTIWGSIVCPGNEIEQRAKYWVATDYMNKAKAADPTLEADCNNYVSQYRVYYPNVADAFMYGVEEGQSYTVSCAGMRAVTKVRTQK